MSLCVCVCVTVTLCLCLTSKPVCPVRACWMVLMKDSLRQTHTYTHSQTYTGFCNWSLLAEQQEKPDEVSPHTRCTLLAHPFKLFD